MTCSQSLVHELDHRLFPFDIQRNPFVLITRLAASDSRLSRHSNDFAHSNTALKHGSPLLPMLACHRGSHFLCSPKPCRHAQKIKPRANSLQEKAKKPKGSTRKKRLIKAYRFSAVYIFLVINIREERSASVDRHLFFFSRVLTSVDCIMRRSMRSNRTDVCRRRIRRPCEYKLTFFSPLIQSDVGLCLKVTFSFGTLSNRTPTGNVKRRKTG